MMNKRKSSRLKIIKTVKILSLVFIGTGILFMIYPLYTNFVTARQENTVLSAWEEQKEVFLKEIEEDKIVESPIVTSTDTTEIEENEVENNIASVTEGSDIEINGTGKERSKYENLTAEDFFPLKILIPKIEVEWIVYEGTDKETLKNGPGHETLTSLPGDIGRCTISGHRTTYGAPFNKVDELVKGDLIYLETKKGELFTYIVTEQEIVKPTDVYILEGSEKKEILLTTCHPKFSASNRMIIIAELINIYPL